MSKLHELLAVESALENQATKCRGELSDTFAKKRHLFEEKRVTFQPIAEGAPAETEIQSDLQSTVASELKWIEGIIVKSLNASYQVACANTKAVADIVLEDDTVIAANVPEDNVPPLRVRLVPMAIAEAEAVIVPELPKSESPLSSN